MELDHLFMFVEPDGPEIGQLSQLGFVETYRRAHPGQGTENVCYCFDNLFLELLWVRDPDEVRDVPIRRTKLFERSRWRVDGTCPFGVAWRGDDPAFGQPAWPYRPPYLPAGLAIPVATDSDEPRQPMMFRSPGSSAPADWPTERRGRLQQAAGYGAVNAVRIDLPDSVEPGPALRWLEQHTILDLGRSADGGFAMILTIDRLDGLSATLTLPSICLS